MLDVLLYLQKVAPIKFEIVAVNMDQKQPGFPEHVLPAYLESIGVEYHIVEKDTYSVVRRRSRKARPPARCARACAGARSTPSPTRSARPRWPSVTTATTSWKPSSSTCSMAAPSRPCRRSCADDGRNVVIRPLAYCNEADIEAYSQLKEFPIIPCNLCGSQENLQRQVVKEMLQEWERKSPGRTEIMFRALQNVVPSQLADRNLFDFTNLRIDESAAPPGRRQYLNVSFELRATAKALIYA